MQEQYLLFTLSNKLQTQYRPPLLPGIERDIAVMSNLSTAAPACFTF